MDMLKLSGFAVLAALMAMLLKRMRPEAGVAVALGAGVLLLALLLPTVEDAVTALSAIAASGGVPQGYMSQLLKVGGVSLLADFSAQTCRDAGEDGLAMKVELAGRVILIALALPFMESLLSHIMSLSP